MAVGFSPKQVMYLPNAVDLRRFDQSTACVPPVPEALAEKLRGVEQSSFVALFAGRLVAAKDLDLLVRGWAACFAGRDDVTLLLAGRGKQGPELMALAQSLGVGQQVRVLGPVEHMEHILPLAHVGILTSRAEGLSNSLLEYMASGLPVIGSCVSGNEDFISPGQTGWLFEPGDEEGLTAGLREAASLSTQRRRPASRSARTTHPARRVAPAPDAGKDTRNQSCAELQVFSASSVPGHRTRPSSTACVAR
jgi:glycosyltransferase involved in cell wall biosynthesis